jgi:hypothetical protein
MSLASRLAHIWLELALGWGDSEEGFREYGLGFFDENPEKLRFFEGQAKKGCKVKVFR